MRTILLIFLVFLLSCSSTNYFKTYGEYTFNFPKIKSQTEAIKLSYWEHRTKWLVELHQLDGTAYLVEFDTKEEAEELLKEFLPR